MPDETPTENVPAGNKERPTESTTVDDLKELKTKVTEEKIQRAIDAVIEVALKNKGEIPKATLDAFQKSLSDDEKKRLAAFLAGDDLRGKLGTLAGALTPDVLADASPAARIIGAIGAAVDRMGIGNQLNAMAEKFGFKGGLGDKASFVTNFLIGLSAKVVESLAWSFKSIYPKTGGILDTAIALRIRQLGIAKADEKTFADAYRKRAKEASSYALFVPPVDIDDARAILNPPKAPTPVTVQITENKPAAASPAKETAASDSTGKSGTKTT